MVSFQVVHFLTTLQAFPLCPQPKFKTPALVRTITKYYGQAITQDYNTTLSLLKIAIFIFWFYLELLDIKEIHKLFVTGFIILSSMDQPFVYNYV
jgi:glucan phosphoethanolaminetransferase (alkaline phosphatase superfamily)